MATPAHSGPFVVYGKGAQPADPAKVKDAILVEVSAEDGMLWTSLPQLGIEVCSEFGDVLPLDMLQRIFAFYAGLRELPAEYINEVEQAQMELVETVFLPWLAVEYGKHPQYLTPPPMETRVTAGDLNLASA